MSGPCTVVLVKLWPFSKLITDDTCCTDRTRSDTEKITEVNWFFKWKCETVKKTNLNQEDSKKEKWAEMSKTYEL